MSELTIIRQALHDHSLGTPRLVKLIASRATLAKRRWRGLAEDGREFGFDLDHALEAGAHFHTEGDTSYYVAQEAEEVLEIPVVSLEQGARLGWSLGNLHFPVQVLSDKLRVPNDSAIRQFLEREHHAFSLAREVFLPLAAAPHHDHGHHHG